MGVAQRRKSTKVKPPRKAIMTPMGLPTTVALEPMFVANTSMIMKGMGSSPKRLVSCRVMALMKRIDVTSSTRAAERAAMAISEAMRTLARAGRRTNAFSTTTSKKRRSSKKPTMIIMPIKKRMISRLANSMRWGRSRTFVTSRAQMPTRAKAKRNRQKSRVPRMKPAKMAVARTCLMSQPRAFVPKTIRATAKRKIKACFIPICLPVAKGSQVMPHMEEDALRRLREAVPALV